jgi:hypothetical protein
METLSLATVGVSTVALIGPDGFATAEAAAGGETVACAGPGVWVVDGFDAGAADDGAGVGPAQATTINTSNSSTAPIVAFFNISCILLFVLMKSIPEFVLFAASFYPPQQPLRVVGLAGVLGPAPPQQPDLGVVLESVCWQQPEEAGPGVPGVSPA